MNESIRKIQTLTMFPDGVVLKQICFNEDLSLSRIVNQNDIRKPYYAFQEEGLYLITSIFKNDGTNQVEEGCRICSLEEESRKKRYSEIYSKHPWLKVWLVDRTSGLIDISGKNDIHGGSREEMSRVDVIALIKRSFPRFSPKPDDRVVVVGKFDYVKDARIKIPNRVDVKYETTQRSVLKTMCDYGTKRGEPPKMTYVFGTL